MALDGRRVKPARPRSIFSEVCRFEQFQFSAAVINPAGG
jgi:hypothetical protein